jgi:hypothetical protein
MLFPSLAVFCFRVWRYFVSEFGGISFPSLAVFVSEFGGVWDGPSKFRMFLKRASMKFSP